MTTIIKSENWIPLDEIECDKLNKNAQIMVGTMIAIVETFLTFFPMRRLD